MLILRVLKSPPHPHLRNHNCICHAIIIKSFTSIARLRAKNLPPRRKIEENELEEKFIRGCGPGGQKIVRSPLFYLSFLLFTLFSLVSLHISYHCLSPSVPVLPPSLPPSLPTQPPFPSPQNPQKLTHSGPFSSLPTVQTEQNFLRSPSPAHPFGPTDKNASEQIAGPEPQVCPTPIGG